MSSIEAATLTTVYYYVNTHRIGRVKKKEEERERKKKRERKKEKETKRKRERDETYSRR